MRILLVYQYFRPEIGAGIERVFYTAKYLVSRGHNVRVITAVPNYPFGKVYPGYKLKLFQKEVIDEIEVLRTFVYPSRNISTLKRLLNYFSFTLSGFIAGIFQKDYDVIIASSPPLSGGVIGLLIALIKKKPLIFEAQDVWPGAAIELGVLKNKFLIGIAKFFETQIYNKSRYIIAPTSGTRKLLLMDNKFLNEDKVITVSNSVDLDTFDQQKIDRSIRQKYKLGNKFVVLYLGTIGLQQGMPTLVKCIEKLKTQKKIFFIIVGEGVYKESMKRAKMEKKLDNMLLLPAIKYREVPSYVNSSNIGIALLRKNRYQDAAIATKVFDYFAGFRPAIISGGAEMREIVERNNAGFWVDGEDSYLLSNKIMEAFKMSQKDLNKIGQNGRILVEKVFNKQVQVRQWDKILISLEEELK